MWSPKRSHCCNTDSVLKPPAFGIGTFSPSSISTGPIHPRIVRLTSSGQGFIAADSASWIASATSSCTSIMLTKPSASRPITLSKALLCCQDSTIAWGINRFARQLRSITPEKSDTYTSTNGSRYCPSGKFKYMFIDNIYTKILSLLFVVFFLTNEFALCDDPQKTDNVNNFTLYVSAKGDDKNPGSNELPFRTIQKAADVAKPGDRILIKEGIYQEFVTIKNSGYIDNRIIFEGERGPNGEYKTVIDPSTIAKGWVRAPEVGPGVYKNTLGLDPKEMTIDDKRIGRINDILMSDGSGFKILAYPSDKRVLFEESSAVEIEFWDGVEALYGYNYGTTYLRLREGENPDDKHIKASPCGSAMNVPNKSYVTIKNLKIRGAEFLLKFSGNESIGNIVEDCHLSNGRRRVFIENGPSRTTIRNNVITMNYYVPEYLGAGGIDQYDHIINRHIYKMFKFTIGNSLSDDFGIRMINPGPDNVIDRNSIFGGLVGISAHTRNVETPTDKLILSNNIIHNMSSVGITSDEGIINVEIFGNLIYDCNINLRLHNINVPSDIGRKVYIYNNRLWNPPKTGNHVFIHSPFNSKPIIYPEYYIYNNSISGGRVVFGSLSGLNASGGLPNFYIFNNIMSADYFNQNSLINIFKNNMIGYFAFNWIGGKIRDDTNKTITNFNETIINEKEQHYLTSNTSPDFSIYKNIESVTKGGLDLSQPFFHNDNMILPGMEEAYAGKKVVPLGATN